MTRQYADAPLLPEEHPIDPGALVSAPGQPVELEIGPGRGGFMIDRLRACPNCRMIGLEIRRKWAAIVDDCLRARGLGERGRVFLADARVALPTFRAGCLSVVFIHFPDPWWKKRHQKRILINPALVSELERLMVPGGELFVQTDVRERALAYQTLIERSGAFAAPSGPPRVGAPPYLAQSPRERRILSDGLPIFRLRYRRSGPRAD